MIEQLFLTQQQLILASASPRRQNFLRDMGIEFSVITARVKEIPKPDESPEIFASRMAREKAQGVATESPSSWIIGADTIVTLADNTILGKPRDENEAFAMLTLLNGTTHKVITGLCLCCLAKNVQTILAETTEVTFMNNPEQLLRAYIASGEPLDKAGSYGIQGLGAILVKSISGSCTNVIGLPVNRLVELLMANQVIIPRT